jgi:hypothetical protein
MSKKSEAKAPTKRNVPWLVLATGAAALALVALIIWPSAPPTFADDADMVVYKTATCGCCKKWVAHVRETSLTVDVVNVANTQAIHERAGVPRPLASCHTALVGDYWIEGHVPADLVQQLLTEKPDDIRGLSVPGMVMGSPGMEGPNPKQYDVVAYHSDGSTSVYATRQGSTGM